jgi:hypothetical protein
MAFSISCLVSVLTFEWEWDVGALEVVTPAACRASGYFIIIQNNQRKKKRLTMCEPTNSFVHQLTLLETKKEATYYGVTDFALGRYPNLLVTPLVAFYGPILWQSSLPGLVQSLFLFIR